MTDRRVFLTNSGLSVANQILLSGLNFLVGLFLIQLATKETYGLYSQLFAGCIFAISLLDSLLGCPLTTLIPGMSPARQEHATRQVYFIQKWLAAILSLFLGLTASVLLMVYEAHHYPWLVGAAFSFFVFTSTIREFQRTLWFINARVSKVLILDSFYVLIALLGGGILSLFQEVNIITALLVLGLANCVAFATKAPPLSTPSSDEEMPGIRATFAQLWMNGRWAMPGALLGVVSNYSFLYMASAMIGLAATADINAARLLLMPVGLLVVAWSKVALPQFSRLAQHHNWPAMSRFAMLSFLAIELAVLVYVISLFFGLPWLQGHLLGEKYQSISPLVWAWAVFFFINSARMIGSNWAVGLGQFRTLFFQSILDLVLKILIAWQAMLVMGAVGVIVAMSIVELIDIVLTWILISQYRKLSEISHASVH